MIPNPTTAKESARFCVEVWGVYNGEPIYRGEDDLALIFCRALRAQVDGNYDTDCAGANDAAYRLVNRVSGFFGMQLTGQAALRAYSLVDEIEALARTPEGPDFIWQTLIAIEDGDRGFLTDNRVGTILTSLKSPKKVLSVQPAGA
ncbi:hypothetical protein [Geopseudomonas aromaticivorans]